MAIETGVKDIYDLAYSPMSAEAHAERMPLRQRYMRPCAEELHPVHWLPIFGRPVRITNFILPATLQFVTGVDIGLDALKLEFRADFWHGIQGSASSVQDKLDTRDNPDPETSADS